jgi:hypothetical protein
LTALLYRLLCFFAMLTPCGANVGEDSRSELLVVSVETGES